MNKLTTKQERFCEEYLVDFNGTKAAIRAGYSKKTANEQAAQHLAKLSIQQYISKLKDSVSEKTELEVIDIINELKLIAFADITKLFSSLKDSKITFVNIKALPDEIRRAIESIQSNKQGLRIKLYSKIDALEKLGKYLKMWSDNQNILTDRSLAELIGK